jgi:hypothetical protein
MIAERKARIKGFKEAVWRVIGDLEAAVEKAAGGA